MNIKYLALLSLSLLFSQLNAEPVKFLLTFDDGPSTRQKNNPTEKILDVLANNQIQNNIKAVFFTQTKVNDSMEGRLTKELLNREYQQQHVLAIHSGVLKRHSSHTKMNAVEMSQFLSDSQAKLKLITGEEPELVRPPYWAFNQSTLSSYTTVGLSMLLTDISAYDGKSWGFRANPRRKSVFKKQMQQVKARIDDQKITALDGILPIVVTFHDTNTWTAKHMEEYLALLLESADGAGIEMAQQPFYGDYDQLLNAAKHRATTSADGDVNVPSKWQSIWSWFGG